MATAVQPAATSQSTSCSRSAVIVPKERTSLTGRPCGPGTIRQATTVFLCTSTPQQRGYTTSTIVPLLVCALTLDRRCAGVPQAWSLRCVLSDRRRQSVLPEGTQVNLVRGLAAPGKPRPSCVLTVVPSPYRAAPHFHPRWWSMDHDYLVHNQAAKTNLACALSGRSRRGLPSDYSRRPFSKDRR